MGHGDRDPWSRLKGSCRSGSRRRPPRGRTDRPGRRHRGPRSAPAPCIERAHEGARPGQAGVGRRPLGQPEVGQIGVVAPVLTDFGRADVGRASRRGGRAPGRGRRRARRPPGRGAGRPLRVSSGPHGACVEVRALDVAHRDEGRAIDLAGLVDGQDVGVVDAGRDLRLALEAGPEVRVVRELGGRS